MQKPTTLLEQAAALRDKAARALRLAVGLQEDDHARLTRYGEELRKQAAELERRAAAKTPSRPAESDPNRDNNQNGRKPGKGRGGSNDPEPQA
jgi:hypothetical protein